MKISSPSLRTLFTFVLAAFLVAAAPKFVAAQDPSPTPDPVTDPIPEPTPEPTPQPPADPPPPPDGTPIDAQQVWRNTSGNTDFNAATSWNGGAGPAPSTGDVAAFTAARVVNPVLSASVSISGLYFAGTGTNLYSLTRSGSAGFTLTGYATTIGLETGDSNAVAIGAENTSGTNTISSVPIVLAPASGSTSTIYQAGGGTLVITGTISGAANLTKTGAGTLTLSGANTYSGDTTIGAGVLLLGNASAIPSGTGKGDVVVGSGGTLSTGDTNFSINGLSGSGLVQKTSSAGVADGGNPDTITIGNNDADGSFSGVLQGSVSGHELNIIKTGTGTQTFSGTNTYAGTTSIQNGTLSINTIKNLSTSSAIGAPTTAANGTIAIGSGATGATLKYTGSGDTTNRIIDLAGTTGGATIDQSGTGLLKFTSNLAATGGGDKTLTLQGSTAGSGEISGIIKDNSSSNITSVSKAGTGAWTLSGVNTYTGTTTISGGTLAIGAAGTNTGGSINTTSSIAVNGGGTLLLNGDGSGVATTRVKDTAAISLAGGTIKTSGASEFTGGTFAAPTGVGLGALTLTANSKLDFDGTKGLLAFGGFSDPSNFTLTIDNYIGAGGSTGLDRLIFAFANQTAADASLPDFAFTYDGTTVAAADTFIGNGLWEITPITAVPEPSTWIGGSLALAALAFSQRRRILSKLNSRLAVSR